MCQRFTFSFWYGRIPGSHNAGTYTLYKSKGLAADQDDLMQLTVKALYEEKLFPWPFRKINTALGWALTSFVYGWSRNQKVSIKWQLKRGVRYLDFRIGVENGNLRTLHGLWGPLIKGQLEQVNDFLDDNTEEVVILYFQSFYGMTDSYHSKLIGMFLNKMLIFMITTICIYKFLHRMD